MGSVIVIILFVARTFVGWFVAVALAMASRPATR